MRLNDDLELARLSFANTDAVAHAATDWALSAGMGSTASIAITQATSNDQRGRVTITSAGTGQGANPTATLTFKRPFANAPVIVSTRGGGSQPTIAMTPTTISTTSVVFTLNGTPVAAETYVFDYVCVA